jgi:hypothetical protein
MINLSRETFHKHSPTSFTATRDCIQASIKIEELALLALFSTQSASCMLSYMFPDQAYMIQAGTLTIALALFLKLHKTRQIRTLTTTQIDQNILSLQPYRGPCQFQKNPRVLLLSNDDSDLSAPQNIIINENYRFKPSLDEKLDQLTNDLIRVLFWKIIPHPLCGGIKK